MNGPGYGEGGEVGPSRRDVVGRKRVGEKTGVAPAGLSVRLRGFEAPMIILSERIQP